MLARMFILLFVFSGAISNAFGREIKSVEEHTFKLSHGGSVTLIANDGAVVVKSWEKPEAFLKITKRVWARNTERANEILKDLRIDIDHSDDRLVIREVAGRDHFRFSSIFKSDRWHRDFEHQIDYELTVPNRINLEIENDEGNVEITQITGSLSVENDEGDVLLNDLESIEIDISVDEGNLLCKNVRGARSSLQVSIDEGSVRVSNSEFASLDLESDEGDFILNDVTLKEGDFQSDEGDIEADLRLLTGGNCKMRTDEGDIFIRILDDIVARLRLQTQEGRIRSDYPLSANKWGDEGEKLQGILGQGQPVSSLRVYSEEGNITLRSVTKR
ncbi:MAG: DUF4097 family beta strand repeat-containing protein [bacterium]